MHVIALMAALATAGALALGGVAPGAAEGGHEFGEHVAMCARATLGKRADPPTVVCSHDDMTMSFATFGEMVRHMQQHHGS